jgi:hypothetical protein
MTDLDPAIWENPTLGKAANNERLDRLEKQQHEDRQARLENREPREVVVDNDYPDWTQDVQERTGTVPSNAVVVHFADEQPNDVVQTGNDMKPEGMSDEEWNGDSVSDEGSESSSVVEDSEGTPVYEDGADEEISQETSDDSSSVESPVVDSSEESDSTQWK